MKKSKSSDKPIYLRDYVRYNALGPDKEAKQNAGKAEEADEDDTLTYNEQQAKLKGAIKEAIEEQASDAEDGEDFFTIKVTRLLAVEVWNK